MSKSLIFTLCLILIILGANSQNIIIRNPGCNAFNSQGTCTGCSTRYYMDSTNICQPVNTNCNTYDQISGDCLSCYPGWGLIEGTCLPGLVTPVSDPNCHTFVNNTCTQCSYGYYFNSN